MAIGFERRRPRDKNRTGEGASYNSDSSESTKWVPARKESEKEDEPQGGGLIHRLKNKSRDAMKKAGA